MITFLVCDDDKLTRILLKKIINDTISNSKVIIANDGIEAITIFKKEDVHIVLLDIEMPNLNGIETAEILTKMNDRIKIIFITAYTEFALDSFNVHPYDYILKPINIERLRAGLKSLCNEIYREKNYKKENNAIFIKQRHETFRIAYEDVLYLEKVDRSVLLHTSNSNYIMNKNLSEVEILLNEIFFRVHKSFIVNLRHINKIKNIGNSYIIEFKNTSKVAYMSKYKYVQQKKSYSYLIAITLFLLYIYPVKRLF
ncbi:MAG: LytTR family DNA-binding domain-containing protein [Anaeromicrobium sp.]|jgi:two-component system LytT family response regulator|uniref:LytR/AlgR family response regulator transcription factor n=1 Tax=Anaeromicrobium sp. TaxID=1929132 RepID=UPI0025D5329E|nr:LytTR family DNA-binding domain-containing protein [Anaeromicrobium sp.]MCT4593632.1 LytTR family DNA-binding domain-containing protein [Anaeromicrobium sp.]